ncbi:uncharacterized protein isoform X2 [Rhodnius prolixus]|uniref:uncharacterized protein isoform X2 n=1 Tax=Rhodnius prolixus TaxID=13249 RepID=UPI003D18956D
MSKLIGKMWEGDAVPSTSGGKKTPNKKKDREKWNYNNSTTDDKPPSYHATQNIHGNVINITGCSGGVHVGPRIDVGCFSKKKSKRNNSKNEKTNAVMTECLDVLTVNDIWIIRDLINISWDNLAKHIKAHANHVQDGLPQAKAVEKVLCAWIEEQSDCAMVAILVHFLWRLRETKAATTLAIEHCKSRK